MKQCKKCWNNVDDNFRFCPNCGGTEFSEPEEEIVKEKEKINLPKEREEKEKNVVQVEKPEEVLEMEAKNVKQFDKKKIYWISGIVVAVIVVVLVLFWGNRERNEETTKKNKKENKIETIDNKKEYTEEEKNQNAVLLLEYAMNHFSAEQGVELCDLTHDGLDELVVVHNEQDIFIDVYSVTEGEVCNLASEGGRIVCIYEKDKKSYLYLYTYTDVIGDTEFSVFSYNANGAKEFLCKKVFSDGNESWTKDTEESSQKLADEAREYLEDCSMALIYEGDIAEIYDLKLPNSLSELCLQYFEDGYKSDRKEEIGKQQNDFGEEYGDNEVEEIASLAINDGGCPGSARIDNGVVYYSVEDDYRDTWRINQYNISSQENVEVSGTGSIEYIDSYKNILFGIGEDGLYRRAMGDNTFKPLLNELVLPSFCIMNNVMYYLGVKSSTYVLRSYDIVTGNQEDIYAIPRVGRDKVRIYAATSSFVLINGVDGADGATGETWVINKNGTDTGIRIKSDSICLSWNEADCIYKENEDGGIAKINLASGESRDILTPSDLMSILGVDNVTNFAFLGNELYVLSRDVLYKVEVADKRAQEIMADVREINVDEDYLFICCSNSNTYMDGIPLFYYKQETGVQRIE